MKIKILRTMRLDGKHVEKGKTYDVTKESGDFAIRHRWAEEVKAGTETAAKAGGEGGGEGGGDGN